jgi:pilus assembly protein CpaE
MGENDFLVQLQIKNPALEGQFEKIIRSLEGFQLLKRFEEGTPDLLILELGNDKNNGFQYIQSLFEMNLSAEIFLTSNDASSEILLQAIKIGAKEFFPQPLKQEEVKEALERFLKRKKLPVQKEHEKKGRIITVIGSKGGVGTTTTALNLAVYLAGKKKDRSVALLDMNMLFGEIPLFLQIEPKYHWGEVIKNVTRLDKTFLSNLLVKHASGVNILPSPSYFNNDLKPFTASASSSELLRRLLLLMQSMFDFVIIDAGRFLNEMALKILEVSDHILLVSILSVPSLFNTNKFFKMLKSIGSRSLDQEKVFVVINRYLKNSEISLEDAEAAMNKKIFWVLPNDYNTTMSAINQGKSLLEFAPKAPLTKSIKGLTDILLEEKKEEENKRSGVLGSIKKAFF